jgi:glycosyltransferase involved in cell wall biosynthesis
MGYLTLLFYLLSLFYVGFGFVVITGLCVRDKRRPCFRGKVSVAVVARDEEKSLPNLLERLCKLKDSSRISEFILVDDDSTDRTGELMEAFARREKKARVIRLRGKPDSLPGKKWGITKVMETAATDFVFFTDADCLPPLSWVKRGRCYLDEKTGMAIGAVFADQRNWFAALESTSGALFTFALAPFSQAPYCSGGNMVVSVKAFKTVQGYEGTPVMASGDDMFLLQKIQKSFIIKPMYSRETAVLTHRLYRPGEYAEKNKRKYGKNFYLRPWQTAAFLAGVFYVTLIPVMAAQRGAPPAVWAVLGGKALVEWAAFTIGAIRMGRNREIPFFPIFALVYPVKVILFSFWGAWKGYRWKSERKIH